MRASGWIALLILLLPAAAVAQTYPEVDVAGETIDNGVFDPSIEYLPDGSEGWLFYSWVGGEAAPWGPVVETHLARTTDHGASFTFSGVVNPAIADTVVLADGVPRAGFWNYEVSSVAHDPDDPGREWKLFAHRIFRPFDPALGTLETHHPDYSWIVYRTAPHPTGPWSAEVALFGSSLLPRAPFTTQVDVSSLDPSLAALIVYSEPGAYYAGGTLYVSLTGLVASGADRIVLLASDDRGATWRYVGTPLTSADMVPLGFQAFDGSAIVEQAGRTLLLGTPQSASVVHDGTLVFEFADLATGALARDAGVLRVLQHVPPQPALITQARGGGQADYHEQNTVGGLLMPQLTVAALPRVFRVFATGTTPLGATAAPLLGSGAGPLALLASVLAAAFAVCRRRAQASSK